MPSPDAAGRRRTAAQARRRTKVFLVAPGRACREALAMWLDATAAYAVVGAAGDADGLAGAIAETGPDVLLADARVLLDVLETLPAGLVPLLALSTDGDDRVLREALARGTCGGVGSRASLHDLATALRATAREEVLCTPRAAALLTAQATAAGPAPGDALTAREREILELVDAGLTNKAIALRLGLSAATVKCHVHNVLEKLGASRRGEAAALLRDGRARGAAAP